MHQLLEGFVFCDQECYFDDCARSIWLLFSDVPANFKRDIRRVRCDSAGRRGYSDSPLFGRFERHILRSRTCLDSAISKYATVCYQHVVFAWAYGSCACHVLNIAIIKSPRVKEIDGETFSIRFVLFCRYYNAKSWGIDLESYLLVTFHKDLMNVRMH